MATIVQSYGPIYGEPVNGTVSGRPNGSIYVPTTNTISITVNDGAMVKLSSGKLLVTGGPYHFNAISQDPSSNVQVSLYEDADCSVKFGSSHILSAGNFNGSSLVVGSSDTAPTSGTKYYIRAELMNGEVMIASSDIVEVEGQ